MKKILFTILMLVGIAYGQSTVYLRADTIKMQRTGGNSNLQILNSTRDSTNGVLINDGNGVTSFKRIRAINDSQFVVGDDTVTISGAVGGGNTIYNSDDTLTSNRAIEMDGKELRIRSNGKELFGLFPHGSNPGNGSAFNFFAEMDTSFYSFVGNDGFAGPSYNSFQLKSTRDQSEMMIELRNSFSETSLNHYLKGGTIGVYYKNSVFSFNADSTALIFPLSASTNTGLFALAHDTTTGQIVRIPMSGGSSDSAAILINANGGGYELINFQTVDTTKIKNLLAGTGISLDSTATGITINSTGGSTIYNADDTLTGNRVVEIENKYIAFNGDKGTYFYLNPWTNDFTEAQALIGVSSDTSFDHSSEFNTTVVPAYSKVAYNAKYDNGAIMTSYLSNSGGPSIENRFTGAPQGVFYKHQTLDPDSTGAIFPFTASTTDTVLYHNLTTGQIERRLAGGSGGGGVTTLAAIGASPNANGATIAGTTLNLEPASASYGGVVTTGTQTFAGAKTFSSNITVSDLSVGTGNTSDSTNVAIGLNTLTSSVSGMQYNVAVGQGAMANFNNSSADYNTAVGFYAMNGGTNASGTLNTGIGIAALQSITSGNYNTVLGGDGMNSLTTGSYNTSVGYGTANNITSGSYNTAVGHLAGKSNADSSVYLGNQAGEANTLNSRLFIDNTSTGTPLIYGHFSADSLRFNGAVSIRDVDSSGTAQNMLYITQEGRIMKAAVPSGGGGGLDTTAAYSDPYFIANGLGSNIKFQSLGRSLSEVTTVVNLADGTMRGVVIYVRKQTTLTGVKWFQGTQGNYTADEYNGVGLYSVDHTTGNMTLVASSTNDGDIWKATTNTVASKAFSSTYVANPGTYMVVALYNSSSQTTAPSLGQYQTMQGGVSAGDWANSLKQSWSLAAQNSLPASPTGAGTTAANQSIWFALY